MALDSFGQRRQDRSAIRRDPAFALVPGRAHRNHQVLNRERFIPLEAGTGRDLGGDHFLFDLDPRGYLAAQPPLLPQAGLLRFRAFVHAAWLDRGTTLQALQAGDFVTLIGHDLLQRRDLREQFDQQSFKLGAGQVGERGWWRHMMHRVHAAESVQGKNGRMHTLLLLLRKCVIGAQPRARRWRVLRTPAVKRATETTVLAPIRQGAGEL